ncbi:DNA polymerase III subunit delta [Fulvitalea axinellae]|uniref:DNA polymerase III subunit delta n=1 Tax=Fulvitalea axinellae TaxID=1182444 RepID=A0AAU9CLD0_9BACT|nr:DNA polymerase III subunit delta [Fulvitalea axinellae]
MLFAEIKGQEAVKEKLIGAVAGNHVAHAQLFSGPTGSPTLAMALAFSTFILCENRQEHDACGQCPSCHKMTKLTHPDMHFSFPVSGTTKITKSLDLVSKNFLDPWRKFLTENPYGDSDDWALGFGGENKQLNISKEESRQIINALSLKAFEGRYKIMLIWLPEFMHPTGANALLKILEEPPQDTFFFLVSQHSEQLLTTIRSRTQQVKINGFSDEELSATLNENYGIPAEKASSVAVMADGNIKQALTFLEEVEDPGHESFRNWMRLCYGWDFTGLVASADSFQKMTKVERRHLLEYGLNIMRESLIYQYQTEKIARLTGNEAGFVQRFSKTLTPEKISESTELINTALYHLERNANPKILFMDLSLDIARLLRK